MPFIKGSNAPAAEASPAAKTGQPESVLSVLNRALTRA